MRRYTYFQAQKGTTKSWHNKDLGSPKILKFYLILRALFSTSRKVWNVRTHLVLYKGRITLRLFLGPQIDMLALKNSSLHTVFSKNFKIYRCLNDRRNLCLILYLHDAWNWCQNDVWWMTELLATYDLCIYTICMYYCLYIVHGAYGCIM